MQSSPYRDPPPYPGHSKQLLQPGLRQSFSGSETSTDVSLSSNENLSTSQRQEPQGEETHSQEMYYDLKSVQNGYSMLARLGMQIPFDLKDLNNQQIFATTTPQNVSNVYATTTAQYYPTTVPLTVPSTEWQNSQIVTCTADSQMIPMLNTTVTVPSNIAYTTSQCWSQQNIDPQVLQYLSNLPPPPEYPRAKSESDSVKKDLCRSYEMLDKVERTRSQPDLTRFESQFRQTNSPVSHFYVGEKSPLTKTEPIPVMESNKDSLNVNMTESALVLARTKHIVDLLSNENKCIKEKIKSLAEELTRSKKRVVALQKCEHEISKVTEEYQTLEQKSRKLQQWEAAYRRKLDEENKKLMAENRYFREQLQGIGNPINHEMSELDIRTELRKKESIIANLMSVNKELHGCKDLMQEDIVRSHQTLVEQKSAIEILDSALTNAQSNVVRLEEECKKKQLYMDRLDQLQRAFGSLQVATEKREQMEQQLRNRLEKELEQLRRLEQANQELGFKSLRVSKDQNSHLHDSIGDLKKTLQEKDTRLLQLEAEAAKWEQRCLTESTKKQLGQTISPSGDVCKEMAVYQKSALETEKLLAESKADKLRHMEEAFQATKKSTELEAKVKELQTSLVEKEAMVKALQRSSLGRSSGVRSLHCSPLHSSLMSTTGSLTRQVEDSTFRDFGIIKHTKSGSASDVGLSNSFEVDTSSCQEKHNQSSDSEGKDEDEHKLWQV